MVLLENETDLFVAQGGALFWLQVMDRGFVEVVFAGPAVVVHARGGEAGSISRRRTAP